MIAKRIITALLAAGLLAFYSCEKEVDERESDELLRLEAYMRIHYPDLEPTESGLYYLPIVNGEGPSPKSGDYLLYKITGQNLDGKVFETTDAHVAYLHYIFSYTKHYSARFRKLNDTENPNIKGLEEGLGYLNEGDSARFIMPSKLAYGFRTYSGLRPYSSVIFDVKLLKVVNDPEVYELEIIENYITENYELSPNEYLQNGIYLLEGPIVDDAKSKEEGDEDENDEPQSINEGDVVSLYYTGRFLDHWVFDTNVKEVAEENNIYNSSRDYSPIDIAVGGDGHIEGFSRALELLLTKSSAKIIIPSTYAYKEVGTQTIQPYTPLIFELDILSKESADDEEKNTID